MSAMTLMVTRISLLIPAMTAVLHAASASSTIPSMPMGLIPIVPLPQDESGMLARALKITGATMVPPVPRDVAESTHKDSEETRRQIKFVQDQQEKYKTIEEWKKRPRLTMAEQWVGRYNTARLMQKYIDDPTYRIYRVVFIYEIAFGLKSYWEGCDADLRAKLPSAPLNQQQLDDLKEESKRYFALLHEEMRGYSYSEVFEALGGFDSFGFNGTGGLIEELRRLYDLMCSFPAEREWPVKIISGGTLTTSTVIHRPPPGSGGDLVWEHKLADPQPSMIRTLESVKNGSSDVRWKGMRALWTQTQNLSVSARDNLPMLRHAQMRLGDINVVANVLRYHLSRHLNGGIGDETAAMARPIDEPADRPEVAP